MSYRTFKWCCEETRSNLWFRIALYRFSSQSDGLFTVLVLKTTLSSRLFVDKTQRELYRGLCVFCLSVRRSLNRRCWQRRAVREQTIEALLCAISLQRGLMMVVTKFDKGCCWGRSGVSYCPKESCKCYYSWTRTNLRWMRTKCIRSSERGDVVQRLVFCWVVVVVIGRRFAVVVVVQLQAPSSWTVY